MTNDLQRRVAMRLLLLGALAAGACNGDDVSSKPASEPETAGGEKDREEAAAKAARRRAQEGKKAAAARAARERYVEKRARALLDSWLAAQNDNELGKYQALYSIRFSGTRRLGKREVSYDRKGWLEERGKDFRRHLEVGAERVRVRVIGNSAVIRFHQKRVTRKHKEVGPKRMIVIRESGGMRIASEAMLRPRPARSETETGVNPRRFMFVIRAGGPRLVLSAAADPEWASGAPFLLSRAEVAAAGRKADIEAIPETLREMRGQRVHLFSTGGLACSGKVGTPILVRRLVPHFSTRGFWAGESKFGGNGEAAPDAIVARDTWELGEEVTLLAAPLDGREGDCTRALWARTADISKPVIFLGTPAAGEVKKEIAGRVRGLPVYKKLQTRFRKACASGRSARWESFGGAAPEVRVWKGANREYQTFFARSGRECGGFAESMWALYEIIYGKSYLHSNPRRPGNVRPMALLDVNGDRLLEVLAAPGRYDSEEAAQLWQQRKDSGLERVGCIEAPVLD
jgi:hypothetical protein